MSSKPAVLFQSTALGASEATVYTSPAGLMTLVTKFSSYNSAGSSVTVSAKVVASGSAAGTTHIQATRTLLPGESYGWPEIVGQTLNPGDFISVFPGVSGLNVRGSGTQTTI